MKSVLLLTGFLILFTNTYAQSNPSVTYVERNEFQLKFGASKEALPIWKEYLDRVHERDKTIHARLLTDVSGTGYTLILEIYYTSFAEAEPSQCRLTHQSDWKAFYEKFIPLCEKTTRTYFKMQTDF